MEKEELSTVSGTNGKLDITEKKLEAVEGKVDWRGRPALRGRHGGVANSVVILAAVGLENLASLSLAVNLIMYFLNVMHISLPDGSNMLTNYMATSYILAVAIAVFADTFIGRYKTVIISLIVELVGLLLLTLQAHSKYMKPPECNPFDPLEHCVTVSGGNEVHLYVGLYLVALGSAGTKATLAVHCADQFDPKHPKEKLQMSSFFNWILLSVCVGGVVSVTLVVWIQDYKGWDLGFGIATAVMAFATVVFLAGLPGYRISTVQGSTALLEILQVYVAAFRNRKQQLPEDPEELYEISRSKARSDMDFVPHRDNLFRFLDKAAIVQTPTGATATAGASPWRQCRLTQVEHAKTMLAMVPIFCSTILMSTCLAQFQTFSIQQGSTMDTRITKNLNMPPATLPIIPLAFLLAATPLYDRLFVPFARRITGHPLGIPPLRRVGVGLVLSILSMAIAALVEVRRKNVALSHGLADMPPGNPPLPLSCFWLAPQYAVFGIADLFTFVGLLEFFYSEAPPALKSMSSSFLWCSMACGYFFSTVLVQAVNAATKGATKSHGWLAGDNINRNHLDLFFWLLAVLSFVNFLNYWFWSSWYKYRPQEVASDEALVVPDEEAGSRVLPI